MKRVFALVLLVTGLLMFAMINTAGAQEAHWTDGTTYQGQINYGPPPALDVVGDGCTTWNFDPPTSYVWGTMHVVENGTEYASKVFEYTGIPGGSIPVNVSSLTNGHNGEGWATWNIGTGQSQHIQFQCGPQPTTTTTSVSPSSTISSTTSTTSSLPSTSTSTSFSESTTTSSNPGTGVFVGSSGTTPSSSSQSPLPNTGSNSTKPLALAGIGAMSLGAWLLSRKKPSSHAGQ